MSTTTANPTQGTVKHWEGDHTALVHVLWDARSEGLLPPETDFDALARHIRRSEYQWAVQELAVAGESSMVFDGRPGEFCHGTRH